jgi:hypothetical protein
VRAAALAGLPADPPLVRRLAEADPAPEVRFVATARVSDPATLERVCRRDASAAVRRDALQRLPDGPALAAIARDHADWTIRRAAADRTTDAAALKAIAASDPDPDVRRAAFVRLSQVDLAALASSAPQDAARVQAVQYLDEAESLERLSAADDPAVRAAARARLARLTEQPESDDPRLERVRVLLSDPALRQGQGPLRLESRVWVDERRYVGDEAQGTRSPPKGKVLLENVSIAIRAGDEVRFRKLYRGNKPRRAEVFAPGMARAGGYFVKLNRAEIDYVEIAEALLRPLGGDAVPRASRSDDKYVRAAAQRLADAWLAAPPDSEARFEGEGEEDDE